MGGGGREARDAAKGGGYIDLWNTHCTQIPFYLGDRNASRYVTLLNRTPINIKIIQWAFREFFSCKKTGVEWEKFQVLVSLPIALHKAGTQISFFHCNLHHCLCHIFS